jgi:recombinational DNA repair protein RecT
MEKEKSKESLFWEFFTGAGRTGPTATALKRRLETALEQNPRLAECTVESLLGSLLAAVCLDLDVDANKEQAYLVPVRNEEKGCLECVFKLGERGLVYQKKRIGIPE